MGRRNYPNREARTGNYPQRGPRTDLMANREQRRATNIGRTLPFGIRRYLDQSDEILLMDMLYDQQEEGDVSQKLVMRDAFGVTLLSRKVLGRQLARGRVLATRLGAASAAISRDPACQYRERGLEAVPRGRVKVAAGRILYTTIECPIVTAEAASISEALEGVGIRAQSKGSPLPPHHVVLGSTTNGDWLCTAEINRTTSALENVLPEAFDIEAWDVYTEEAAIASGLLSA